MAFQIGDKVKIVGNNYPSGYDGSTGIIANLYQNNYNYNGRTLSTMWSVRIDNTSALVQRPSEDLTKLNCSTKMNLKESFSLAFKKEPEKSFRKAGITNSDDYLTEEGQAVFLSWLLKQNGDAFKKEVVDDILAEEDSKKA